MNNLEVCCQDIKSVIAAKEGGADRIELCCALEIGGLTPSIGLIEEAVRIFGKNVFVLIRPRGGDFVYSLEELKVMKKDINTCITKGVSGIVVGCLKENGEIDLKGLEYLIENIKDISITFHRAFDEVKDPFDSLEKVIEAGCHRILTSGQKDTALDGIQTIYELNRRASDRIIILPASGVNHENACFILSKTGCKEIHASSKIRNNRTWKSSTEEIKKIKQAIL